MPLIFKDLVLVLPAVHVDNHSPLTNEMEVVKQLVPLDQSWVVVPAEEFGGVQSSILPQDTRCIERHFNLFAQRAVVK